VKTRSLALDLLLNWQKSHQYAAQLLDHTIEEKKLSNSDGAFIHDIVYLAIRNLSLLDHWIDQITNGKKLEIRIRMLLRMGLVQTNLMKLPDHAAVFETVALAGHAKGLVNAVMRRAIKERDLYLEQIPTLPLEIRFSHPKPLIQYWEQQFTLPQIESLCDWNQHAAPVYVRKNTLKPAAQPQEELTDTKEVRPNVFLVKKAPRQAIQEGYYYAQDISTLHPVDLLNPKANEKILDACAAPGGKTAYIAQLMNNQGEIVACDPSAPRIQKMMNNLYRLNVLNTKVLQHDFVKNNRSPISGIMFDAALVDVPCSNSGVMRRRIDVRWRWKAEDLQALLEIQKNILWQVSKHIKQGGRIVYSTCSIDRNENEEIIKNFLANHPNFRLIQEQTYFPPDSQSDGSYCALLKHQPKN
jgi:16S rRNA (cytosine967-C5)-methyltransferase